MRHSVPLHRRLIVLAVACCLTGGSLASTLASQVCQHMALHHAMQHSGPAGGSCWCDDMTGGGNSLEPVVVALAPATTAVAPPAGGVAAPVFLAAVIPESPSFPPTPPPPNGRPG